jgi:hypothetical protein
MGSDASDNSAYQNSGGDGQVVIDLISKFVRVILQANRIPLL